MAEAKGDMMSLSQDLTLSLTATHYYKVLTLCHNERRELVCMPHLYLTVFKRSESAESFAPSPAAVQCSMTPISPSCTVTAANRRTRRGSRLSSSVTFVPNKLSRFTRKHTTAWQQPESSLLHVWEKFENLFAYCWGSCRLNWLCWKKSMKVQSIKIHRPSSNYSTRLTHISYSGPGRVAYTKEARTFKLYPHLCFGLWQGHCYPLSSIQIHM